jgi:hypothetical protein
LGGNPGSPVLREHSIVWKWVVGSYSGRGGLPLWRLRAGCAPQTAHGAVTGTTRPSNANPERSALKTTPVTGAPRHDRARGRNSPGESLYDLDSRQMSQVFIIYMFETRVRTCALPFECLNEVEVSPTVDYRMTVAKIV